MRCAEYDLVLKACRVAGKRRTRWGLNVTLITRWVKAIIVAGSATLRSVNVVKDLNW
jgi:hypothetical protein